MRVVVITSNLDATVADELMEEGKVRVMESFVLLSLISIEP